MTFTSKYVFSFLSFITDCDKTWESIILACIDIFEKQKVVCDPLTVTQFVHTAKI